MPMLPLLLLAVLAQDTASAPVATWRQEASYRIAATLADSTGTLRGTQELRYRNNSPDTIQVLVFQLPLNALPVDAGAHSRTSRGYTRLGEATVAGATLTLEWPLAPDSSLVRLVLPAPLPPGASTTVELAWESRPPLSAATGGHFDFSHWYPRLAAYGRHGWPEHPFDPDADSFGEFATYRVRLDLPIDQVMGATGLPTCGDPGWVANRRPAAAPVHWWSFSPSDTLTRALMDADTACAGAAAGRKIVVWQAERVPDFAMSFDPTYRYEEGDFRERPVRVLYRAGQERVWGAGLVARRTEAALAWLEEVAGDYPWSQTTTAQLIGEGSSSPPMLALSDRSGPETIVHLLGRQYFGGVIAVDAWNERWLGEGLAQFQAGWYLQVLGRKGAFDALEWKVLGWDLDGLSQPIANPPDAFRDRATWLAMTSDRGQLFFHQLRTAIGGTGAAESLLHRYHTAYAFRRADEAGFRAAAESVSGQALATLFRQWLHETVLYDYAVGVVSRRPVTDSLGLAGWATDVEVVRKARGEFPVEVWVIAEHDTNMVRVSGVAASERVAVFTRSRPLEVAIDPHVLSHDWNMLNNRRRFAGGLLPPMEKYLGAYFGRRSRRDALTLGVAPTAWYNQEGGWTLGLRGRTDYLGRFDLDEAYLNMSTGWSATPEPGRVDVNASVRLSNPTWLRHPGLTEWMAGSWVEGRAGAGIGVEKSLHRSLADSAARTVGLSLEWLTVRTPAYVDTAYYDDVGTLELTGSGRMSGHAGGWRLAARATAAMGYAYPNAPVAAVTEQVYFRGTLSATARRPVGDRMSFGVRGYAGTALGQAAVVRQRRIYVAGSDPYEQFADPFLRSRGSIFRLDGVNYQSPGGADARGLSPTLSARQVYGLNVEVERSLLRSGWGMVHGVSAAAFVDGVLADGDLDTAGANTIQAAADAGLGLRLRMQVGQAPFEVRFDVPLWVSIPTLAQDTGPGNHAFGFRWTFSLSPVL
jgi:hypothetical protein